VNPIEEPASPPRQPVALWITIGLVLWGGYLAVGAILSGGNHALLRGAIVFSCTLAFLALWWVALAMRQRRLKAEDDS
jgi:predicted Co/Zn/Cd cation transporter (cation efflux family)